MITSENWNFSHYKDESFKSMITFGARPSEDSVSFIYYCSVLDGENNEMFQTEFSSLDLACAYINKKYSGLWDFVNLTKNGKKGSCSSCVAH